MTDFTAPRLAKAAKAAKHLLHARSGNVAVLFALAAVPLFGTVGMAVDYSRAAAARTEAQRAVDGAALAGAQKLAQSENDARTVATQVFGQLAPAALRATPPTIVVSADKQSLSVCTTGTMPTTIARVIGHGTLPVGACADAARPTKQYIDVYLALDVSASMGLAADEAGRDQLRALTGCAFACHEKEGGQAKSNYDVAKEKSIKTRVDILRDATQALATDLLNPSNPSNGANRNEYRLAMYSIDDDAKKLLGPPTPHKSRIDNEIERIQLAFNTQFDIALPVIDQEMGAQMDGLDRQRPRKVMFLVTDGVQSKRHQPWESTAFRPIDVSLCDTIKRRGIPMAVLNIRYVPMPAEAAYRGTVQRFQDQLAPNLRACASDGMYFEAERPQEILSAFEKFSSLMTSYRIAR